MGIKALAVLWDQNLAFAHGKKPRVDLLASNHASAKGIEGKKYLSVDHSCILVVPGCCVRPRKENVWKTSMKTLTEDFQNLMGQSPK